MAAGAQEKWVARELDISIRTVKNQKWDAFNRLDVRSIVEFILRRQEERMETNKFVVIGKYEDSTNTIVVSREVVAPTAEIAETIFKMALEGEGMGTPIIEACYGPYTKT